MKFFNLTPLLRSLSNWLKGRPPKALSHTNKTYWDDNRPHTKPCIKNMNPSAQPYTPYHHTTSADQVKTPVMTDFVKYLTRRWLVTTGLNQFDDQPDSFRVWQSPFLNAIKGLDLSDSEELDLLTKWLGKESSQHVRRICQVHVNDPDAALRKEWDRLSKLYASPEAIEKALFKKLDKFPKISSKDHIKLRELGDLLMELQSAKEDGYLPGLSFLDTARDISPIVEKLQHALQEKWISKGSRFKDEHTKCLFPPFSFFAGFICYEADTRNEPSFALSSSSSPHVRDKPVYQTGRITVSVHKTDISPDPEHDMNISQKQVHKLGRSVFQTTENDNKLALSIVDTVFLKIMDWCTEMRKATGLLHCPSS